MKFIKPKLLVLFVSFLFLANIFPAYSQTSPFSFQKYVNESGDTLNYRQLSPDYDTMQRYPLVIFLHGSGERGSDNEAQLKWGVMNFAKEQNMIMYHAIIIAPQCPEKMSWANLSRTKHNTELYLQPTPSRPMELLIELIQKLKRELPIDTNRIYITGLSMGGFGTYDAIERYPHLFAAAVPVCGGGNVSRVASIAHIPIWIFLGAEDPTVNPVFSLNMLEALTKSGAHPGFTQYPEVGHFSWLGAYSDPLMMEWMFRQHK
ncbi:MAG: prolyl oligopeptidase family serine peptidase [Bacteroidota bacterium]|nr:prolyl oligopeptidase family serine peptidase [Bacteroidota bacterium]